MLSGRSVDVSRGASAAGAPAASQFIKSFASGLDLVTPLGSEPLDAARGVGGDVDRYDLGRCTHLAAYLDESLDGRDGDEPLGTDADAFEFHAFAALLTPSPERGDIGFWMTRESGDVVGRLRKAQGPLIGKVSEVNHGNA